MTDPEVFAQAVRCRLEKRVVGVAQRHHQVRGQRHVGGAGGPHVQVMHTVHTGQRFELAPHGGQVDVLGHAVEHQVQRLAKQPPGAEHDHERDHEAGGRVEPGPAEPQREPAGHHHTGRDQRITGHVNEGPLNVDVVRAPAHEQQRGAQVDEDADAGDDHHRDTLNRLGRGQPAEGFPGQRAHRHEQQQRVRERRQNRRPLPAIGVARTGPHPAGERATPGQHQAGDVAEVVAGVGQQSERVHLPAVKSLDGHEGGVQHDADREGPVEAGGRVVVGVAGVLVTWVGVTSWAGRVV